MKMFIGDFKDNKTEKICFGMVIANNTLEAISLFNIKYFDKRRKFYGTLRKSVIGLWGINLN